MQKDAKLCVIYTRVSTEEQSSHGYSLASQKIECEEKAVSLGWEPRDIKLIEEKGESGGYLDRPGLTRLRQMVKEGLVRTVIVYDPDRLARVLMHQLMVTEELDKYGVDLIFVKHEYQKTPEGQLFLSLRGMFAEYERAKIRERTLAGRKQKLKQGQIYSNPRIYGYDYESSTGNLVVIDSQAEIIRMIYHWYVYGDESGLPLSGRTIADKLSGIGISSPRSGRRWWTSKVIAMLSNETYAGTFYANKWSYQLKRKANGRGMPTARPKNEQIPIPVPAIVGRELWDKAQKIRMSRVNVRGRKADTLLSGLTYCGCGSKMRVIVSQYGKKSYNYYSCTEKRSGVCTSSNTRCDIADGIVCTIVQKALNNPDTFISILKDRRRKDTETGRLRSQRCEVERLIEKTKEDEVELSRQLCSKRLSEDVYDRLSTELRARAAALEKQASGLDRLIDELAGDQNGEVEYNRSIETFKSAVLKLSEDQELCRAVIRRILHRVVIELDGSIVIYGRLGLDPFVEEFAIYSTDACGDGDR